MKIDLTRQGKLEFVTISNQASDYIIPDVDKYFGFILDQDTDGIEFVLNSPGSTDNAYRIVGIHPNALAIDVLVEGVHLHAGQFVVLIYQSSGWLVFEDRQHGTYEEYPNVPTASTVYISHYATRPKKLKALHVISDSGTVDMTVKIGGVAITSLTDVQIDSTGSTTPVPFDEGIIAIGEELSVTYSSPTGIDEARWTLEYEDR